MTQGRELIADFHLRDAQSGFFGPWQEGMFNDVRVAFQSTPEALTVHVGNFDADVEQITDLYLGRASVDRPLPEDGAAERIDAFLDDQGRVLGRRYFLYASGAKDYPQLRVPAVRDGLAGFSDAITEIGFYEANAGLFIEWDTAVGTAETVRADVRLAVSMVRALSAARAA